MKIITEIGLNHLGKYDLASRYLDVLLALPIDGITFQVRESEFYEREEKKHLKLSNNDYKNLRNKFSDKLFGIAIADYDKIDFFESIDTDFYKVIRNDMTNEKLMSKLLSTGKRIIVSTGLSSDKDITQFLSKNPGSENITLNQTQLSYDEEDCNLQAIDGMRDKYGVDVSFGSHCRNKNILYMSLCYNPSHLLFYVRLDDTIKYPDHTHAIPLCEINDTVTEIKKLLPAIGNRDKNNFTNKIPEMTI